MLKKINFPKEVLIFSAVAQAIAPTLIQTVLIFLLFAYLKIAPPLTLFLVPLAIIPLLLVSLGLVFFFSVLSALTRDIGSAIGLGMTFLMYLTPILYATPPAGIITTISQYNPFYYLVKIPRDLFLFGSTDHLWAYFYSTLFAVAVFWLGWIAFRLSGTRMVERL
jgi:lipopolysaccharide transport system permease protein